MPNINIILHEKIDYHDFVVNTGSIKIDMTILKRICDDNDMVIVGCLSNMDVKYEKIIFARASDYRNDVSFYLFYGDDKYYDIIIYHKNSKPFYDIGLDTYKKYKVCIDCSYYSYEESLRYIIENCEQFLI